MEKARWNGVSEVEDASRQEEGGGGGGGCNGVGDEGSSSGKLGGMGRGGERQLDGRTGGVLVMKRKQLG